MQRTTAVKRVRDLEKELKAAKRAAEQSRMRCVMRIRVTTALRDEIKRVAKRAGVDMSDLARGWIKTGLAQVSK